MQEKIKKLSYNRIKYLIENKIPFYKGYSTYLNGIQEELQEVMDEIKDDNSVYLEDELGDIFWDYICLLYSLEHEGKISSVEKVFERCYTKFSQRVGCDGCGGHNWNEIKSQQKEVLKLEHNNLYKCK